VSRSAAAHILPNRSTSTDAGAPVVSVSAERLTSVASLLRVALGGEPRQRRLHLNHSSMTVEPATPVSADRERPSDGRELPVGSVAHVPVVHGDAPIVRLNIEGIGP